MECKLLKKNDNSSKNTAACFKAFKFCQNSFAILQLILLHKWKSKILKLKKIKYGT